MSEYSYITSVTDYISIMLTQWMAVIAGLLGIVKIVVLAFPVRMKFIDPIQKSQHAFVPVALVLLVFAGWKVFDQKQREILEIKRSATTAIDVNKLPNGPDGLKKGQLWNNGGILSIAQ